MPKTDFPKYPVVATEYQMQTPRGMVLAARLRDENGFYVQVTLPKSYDHRSYVKHWEKFTDRGGSMRPVPPSVHEICDIIDEIFEHDDKVQE